MSYDEGSEQTAAPVPEMPAVLFCNNFLLSVFNMQNGEEQLPPSPMDQLLLGVAIEENHALNFCEITLRFGEPVNEEMLGTKYFYDLTSSMPLEFLIQNTDKQFQEISRNSYVVLEYTSSWREYSTVHKNALVVSHKFRCKKVVKDYG